MKTRTLHKTFAFVISTSVLLLSLLAAKTSQSYTPPPGSKERRAILDALRKPVSKVVKTSVTFTTVDLKVSRGWAYVKDSLTVNSKGQPVGNGMTNRVHGLLRQVKGSWRVVEWGYLTDASYQYWEQKHPSVPRALWPHRRAR